MIGADLSSLESTTRNHFVIDLDPDFVEAQNHPHYDPHLDIAVEAGMMTHLDANFYKYIKAYRKDPSVKCEDIAHNEYYSAELFKEVDNWADKIDHHFDELDDIRHKAKTTNYSAMYGVGKAKLSKELDISQKEAGKLIEAYWTKNWSVRKFAASCRVQTIDDQMWVKNPLNNYWYSLRYEKDVFSTVNQGAGDFIFTLWQYFIMQEGIVIRGGFHDEIITTCPEDQIKETVSKLYKAIDKVNEVVQMKVPVGIDYKVGKNYGEVH